MRENEVRGVLGVTRKGSFEHSMYVLLLLSHTALIPSRPLARSTGSTNVAFDVHDCAGGPLKMCDRSVWRPTRIWLDLFGRQPKSPNNVRTASPFTYCVNSFQAARSFRRFHERCVSIPPPIMCIVDAHQQK